MDRPGVEFKLYNAGSILPDREIPDDKSVIVQILGVALENRGENSVESQDWIVSIR